ncbi:MAG: quinone-dependent dihydroorotate dehydrogenase [Bacteroidales bacterium]
MYQKLLRPLLFRFDPEAIHHFVSLMLRAMMPVPLLGSLIRKYYTIADPRLEREVFGIRFPNPVGMAAGFDKEANLYNHLRGLGFGFIEIGTVTPVGQPGNPKPRLFRLPQDQALINRMGFNNQGVEQFVRNLKKQQPRIIIGGNIGKNTDTPQEKAVDDYCACFTALFDHVDYFVVNVSCPNIAGLSKMQDKDQLIALLSAIQEINQQKPSPKPVLLKIAPDLNNLQLDEVVEIIQQTSLNGIIATNTTTSRENLETPAAKVESIGRGGLSGKPIRDLSTQVIAYLHQKSGGSIPIIGVGGIMTPQDALDKIQAGATLVQVYTGFIYSGPSLVKRINKALLKSL